MTTANYAPAPLDSGVGHDAANPPQVMSPKQEGKLTNADPQSSKGSTSQEMPPVTLPTDGSISQEVPQEMAPAQGNPLSQVKCESVREVKTESSGSTREVKTERQEPESKEESAPPVKPEEGAPEPDSEDSFTLERVIEAVQGLANAQESRTGEH